MSLVWWIGALGSACFFLRFLVQWWISERRGRSVVPRSFWWLSLAGAVLQSIYVCSRGELLLLPGFLVTGAIYARSLWLRSGRGSALSPALLSVLGLLGTLVLVASGAVQPGPLAVFACGVVGQALWSSRFVLVWLACERHPASAEASFPRSFWIVSLVGNLLLLVYVVLALRDELLTISLLPGPFVQLRNLLLYRARDARAEPAGAARQS